MTCDLAPPGRRGRPEGGSRRWGYRDDNGSIWQHLGSRRVSPKLFAVHSAPRVGGFRLGCPGDADPNLSFSQERMRPFLKNKSVRFLCVHTLCLRRAVARLVRTEITDDIFGVAAFVMGMALLCTRRLTQKSRGACMLSSGIYHEILQRYTCCVVWVILDTNWSSTGSFFFCRRGVCYRFNEAKSPREKERITSLFVSIADVRETGARFLRYVGI